MSGTDNLQNPGLRVLMTEVRPDPVAAPTGMSAPSPVDPDTYYVNDFGVAVYPESFSYLTPVSGDGLGETRTTITTTPVTVDGSTYTHTVTMSDRTLGPMNCTLTITGVGATTLSWIANGRVSGDSGTGSSYQPNEWRWERLGEADESFVNPNRDGSTAYPFTPNGEAIFPYVAYPERDKRVHGGQPISYILGAESFETCCAPANFGGSEAYDTPAWDGATPFGESATKSLFHYGDRLAHKGVWRYGHTDVVRAVTHRMDVWTYSAREWTGGTGRDTFEVGRALARYVIPGYFNEAKVYDLANFGSPIDVSTGFPQLVGVDNFNTWYIARHRITASVGGVTTVITRSPVASKYMAVVLRNTVTDVAIALACKLPADDIAGEGLRNEELGAHHFIGLFNFWDADHGTFADDEPYAVHLDGYSKATHRNAGWIGSVEFCCIGLSTHVLAAIQALYANGDLDDEPLDLDPRSYDGTVFDREAAGIDPQQLGTVMDRIRLRWERTHS